jgi:hypothetical protein
LLLFYQTKIFHLSKGVKVKKNPIKRATDLGNCVRIEWPKSRPMGIAEALRASQKEGETHNHPSIPEHGLEIIPEHFRKKMSPEQAELTAQILESAKNDHCHRGPYPDFRHKGMAKAVFGETHNNPTIRPAKTIIVQVGGPTMPMGDGKKPCPR